MATLALSLQNMRKRLTLSTSRDLDEESRPRISMTLSDLNVKRTLGTGSFGRVLLVQHKASGKHYALKVLKKAQVVRLKQVEHTLNEKTILDSVNHPFIVPLVSSFQDDINLYIVMEYVAGGELFNLLRKRDVVTHKQRLSSSEAKFYAAEVVLAFEYLHSKNIIYRDLKPENVLIAPDGHIRISDFGFAKRPMRICRRHSFNYQVVPDVTYTLCGTPDYLAPEMIQSKPYGPAVDWYSLGVFIYEMLAGYTPFADDDPMKLYEKIINSRPRFPSYFDPDAKDLCKQLMQRDLSRRFGNLKGGSRDIRNHKWFAEIDWKKIARKQMTPPTLPMLKEEGDASNFDTYAEDAEPLGGSGPDPHRDLFAGF